MNVLIRKIYRLSGLFFPFLYYLAGKKVTLVTLFSLSFIFLSLELLRFTKPNFNRNLFEILKKFLKDKERTRLLGSTNFLISSTLVVIFFAKEIAIISITLSLLGDEAAAILGSSIGKIRFKEKSLEGSLGCLITCLLIGLLFKWFPFFNFSLKQIVITSFLITLFEFLPLVLDDNLILPIISAISMYIFR